MRIHLASTACRRRAGAGWTGRSARPFGGASPPCSAHIRSPLLRGRGQAADPCIRGALVASTARPRRLPHPIPTRHPCWHRSRHAVLSRRRPSPTRPGRFPSPHCRLPRHVLSRCRPAILQHGTWGLRHRRHHRCGRRSRPGLFQLRLVRVPRPRCRRRRLHRSGRADRRSTLPRRTRPCRAGEVGATTVP